MSEANRPRTYILRGITPVLCPDSGTWGEWMDNGDNLRVAADILIIGNKEIRVSTVFLGIDHAFPSRGEPILFETMVFGGKHDGYQCRYVHYHEALAGHEETIKRVTGIDFEKGGRYKEKS